MYVSINKAVRHGWRIAGVAMLGNCSYAVLKRADAKTVYVAPTGRIFSAR